MPHLPEDLADAVRRAYLAPVDDETAKRHVAAMAAAARDADTSPSSAVAAAGRRRRRALRPALAAGLAALVLPAGLAVAGVDLPDVVEQPYEVVGVDLPNQASETAEERTREVRTAPPAAMRERPEQDPQGPPGSLSPAVPDGGVREGHGADDAERESAADPERRSTERSKGRRGDEASDGKRQGGENGTRRSEERNNGRRGAEQRNDRSTSKTKKSPQARPDAPVAGTDARGGRAGQPADRPKQKAAPEARQVPAEPEPKPKPKKVEPPAPGAGAPAEEPAAPPSTPPGQAKKP